MKTFRTLSGVIIILLLFMACTKEENGDGTVNDYKTITVSNITLKWKADTLGFLHVKVSAPTTGWVAAGFDASVGMQNANIIIGYVVNDTACVRDDYGAGQTSHESDISGGGTDDVTNKSGTETGNSTEISFTIPLDSGDSRDRPLVAGGNYTIILAYGDDDDYGIYHGPLSRVITNINL